MPNNDSPSGGDIVAGLLLGGLMIYGVASALKFMLGVASVPETEMGTVPAAQVTPIPTPAESEIATAQAPVSGVSESSDSDDYTCPICHVGVRGCCSTCD